MNNTVIRIENLSKQYQIGELRRKGDYRTFRDAVSNMITSPLKRFKNNGLGTSSSERIWALKDVSFEVKRGEVVGVIGRNGAGKSTLLKILSRITEPTTGRVKLYGRVGSLLEVGTGFHKELSGRENIYLNGAILGMTRVEIKKKFDEIVAFAEIEKFLDTPVKRYSSGMYVRLAFAVAAHLDPEILLVDEVLAVGDAAFQKKCLGKMDDVARSGRTILFVSHNMAIISELCERGVLLDNGLVQRIGPIQEVVQEYLDSAAISTGEWKNTQTYDSEPTIKITEASIVAADKRQTNVISFDADFKIQVEFEVNSAIRTWAIFFQIVNSIGNTVFSSWDTDSVRHDEITNPGGYQAVCHIPGKFLRPGTYTLTLSTRIPKKRILEDCHENALRFEISNVGYTMNKRRLGAITPVLEWTVTRPQGEGID